MRTIPLAVAVLAGWIATLLTTTYIAERWLDRQANPNVAVETRIDETGQRNVHLQPNRNGHYVVTVRINGHPVEAMVDTGATDISIPGRVAEKLDLDRGPEIRYQTAGGPVESHLTHLDSVSVGELEVQDVRGSVNPRLDGEKVLLGMSFLRHVDFTQTGGQLILRDADPPSAAGTASGP